MKRSAHIAALLGILVPAGIALVSTGVAFADDGRRGPPVPPPGMQGQLGGAVRVGFEGSGDDEVRANAGVSMMASTSPRSQDDTDWQDSASGTPPYMRGQKEGIERRFGTTTPPGMMFRDDEGTSTPRNMRPWGAATTTREEGTSTMPGRPGGVFGSFFNWLFGLPASTTIGQVRASLEASSSADNGNGSASSTVAASSTVQLPPPPLSDLFARMFFRISGFFGR